MFRFQVFLSAMVCSLTFTAVSIDDAAAQGARGKNKQAAEPAAENSARPVVKKKTVAEKLIGKIKFAQKELAFKEMADEALIQKHAQKVKKAGLNGRDPLTDLPKHIAISSVRESFEHKWGDGIVSENSSSVVLKFHVVGEPISDRTELRTLISALETVYGGENAQGQVCFAGEGKSLGKATVDRSNLRGIKSALGLDATDMQPYRVLNGVANGQPIELKEGRDLTAEQFDILSDLIKNERPIVVRIEGLDAASESKRAEIKKAAETAATELSKGPQDGLLTWKSDGQSWDFRHQPAQSPALKKLRGLMKDSKDTYIEVSLTDGVLSQEYKEVQFRSAKNQGWDVAVIPSDQKKGLMVDLYTQFKVPYRYSVGQSVAGCDVRINISIEDTAVTMGPARMSSFGELSEMKLINFERDELLTGYLSEPNCTASITKSTLPQVSNAEFDQVMKFDNQCLKLCEAALVSAKEIGIELRASQCRKECVERKGYRECLESVSSPLPLYSIEDCQNGL